MFAAMLAPMAQAAANQGWTTVLPTAAVGLLLCLAVWRKRPELPAWIGILEWAWLILLLPTVLSQTAACWPQAKHTPTIPLVLLLLAAVSAEKGAARAGASVFWLICLLLAGVLGAGVRELEPTWLLPEPNMPEPLSCAVFLLPALAGFMTEDRPQTGWIAAVGLIGTIMSAFVVGGISPGLARGNQGAFYLYSKSLTLFGTAKRLEALASVLLTISWFCLLSWLLSAAGAAAENVRKGWGASFTRLGAVLGASLLLLGWKMPDLATLGGSLLLWIGVPLLFQKNLEKRENNA